MKKILFALLCVLCAGSSYATRYKISDIYELAKANNTEELAKVSNINGHDMYKDTALCHAIKDGNVEAYKLLLAHGAKADHACTKKIPEQDYTKFMDKVAASSATKTTGFWGLSKWLWGALGLGVVGTGAVIAASGSGGGDSGTADNTNKCNGYIASCDTGYKVVDTCQSGNTTMVKCEFDDEHYVKQNGTVYEKLNCVNGTQNGNACTCSMGYINDLCDTFDDTNFINISGTVYHKLNCQNGGTQSGDACDCPEGYIGTLCNTFDGTNYFMDPTDNQVYNKLNCVHGNQNQNSCVCDTGYIGTLCDAFDYTNYFMDPADNQIYNKLNCVHGTQSSNTCNCADGWAGTLCDTAVTCPANYKPACTGGYEPAGTEPCQSGDSTLVGCQEIQCGANATWSESGCNCEQGYENWQSGTGCSLIPLTCGNNAHQDGTQCVCENGYQNWTDGVGCSLTPLTCGNNAHQDGTQCVCESGYQNWQSNTGCSLIPINCNHGTQNGTACSCNTGYVGDFCNTLDSEHYIEQYGQVYEKLNCVHGTQTGAVCECNSAGWEGDLCDTPHVCDSNYISACLSGYDETGNTCPSGDSILVECEPTQCGENAHWEGNACVCDNGYGNYTYGVGCSLIPINCNNGTQNGTACSCNEGWTGAVCDTAVDCGDGYQLEPCSYAEIETSQCQSGNNTLVMCTFNDVLYIEQNGQIYNRLNCDHGHQDANTCVCDTGYTGELCGTFDDEHYFMEPDGSIYQILNCVNGAQLTDHCSCNEGWTGTLCDTPVTCPANYRPSCTGGYELASTTPCPSGDDWYYECQPIQCGMGEVWTESGCIPMSSITNCGIHAYKQNGICVCEPGYENWVYGIGCSVPGINDTGNPKNKYIYSTITEYVVAANDLDTENLYIIKTADGDVTVVPSGVQNVLRNIYINKTGDGHIWGVFTATNPGNILIDNSGTGIVTGIRETNDHMVYNGASADDRDKVINIHNTNNNSSVYGIYVNGGAINFGTIYINSIGNGMVAGIYRDDELPAVGSIVTNSGIINITSESLDTTGNTYGIYANAPINNVSGTINITSNGEITGIYNYGYNTVNNGTINITQNGNAAAYGIYGPYACGTSTNATSGGTGLISMINKGTGNMYGMYSSGNAPIYNAHTDNGELATGTINIVNYSSGEAHGIYGKNVYNETYGQTTSEINIQNLSNGAAYGITAESSNPYVATNSGTININNIGTGAAYGMSLSDPVDAMIYNTGTINITRNSYPDPLDNSIVYNPTGTAGNVFGIGHGYLGTVDNTSGTINITSNGFIYGIYNDGNNINNGTINITQNGNANAYGIFGYGSTTNATSGGTGLISIINNGAGTAYGMLGGSINATSGGTGIIEIINKGNGVAIGMGSSGNVFNVYDKGTGEINITNNGDANVYGLYSQNGNVYNAYLHNSSHPGTGEINITNNGSGDVYGLYSQNGAVINASNCEAGEINITNNSSGDVYGMYAYSSVNADMGQLGQITIANKGTGNAYGMYGYTMENSVLDEVHAQGIINIENHSFGNIYGMYSTNYASNITATSEGGSVSAINLKNLSSGNAIGIYTSDTAINSGTINVNNIGTGSAGGIFGDTNSTITNSGVINITREDYTDSDNNTYTPTGTAGTVIGIYAKSGSTVNNSGEINIATNGTAYGIYVESGSTVTNTGTITINGESCSGGACNTGNYIVLNGSSLYNNGVLSAKALNLNSMGGKVVAGLGSQFVIDNELSGDLNISSDVVMDGNQTTYVANNMIDAGDISELNVRSASAMFDATIADNKHDIVMQMKDFNELTENASLAQFLADNYAKGNGNDLFAALKSLENMSAFNGALAGLTGLDTFTQFAHEDLSAMREISFSMNNKLFENSNRDSFDISDSTGYFSFSNSRNGGSGQYGISSNKITDNLKLGYGMAMANINTGDDNGMHRQNKMWLFYMPATYTNDGYELVVAPKAGFARSEYNRRGYNNMNYEGVIEKRIFGLMNDLRYPLNVGNWTIAPDLAFNAIVYDQSGHEDEQEFSLIIPDDRTVSVETGLGFYTKYEKTLQDGSRFKLNSGFMVYREFGDTYDIKLGIRGMDGTFSLYNNDYEYRGAANIGFDYSTGRLHVYGDAQYFMDNANYANFKGGVSYRF